LAGLLLVAALRDGFRNLSLVGNGVLVGDHDVAGANLGVGGGVLGCKGSVGALSGSSSESVGSTESSRKSSTSSSCGREIEVIARLSGRSLVLRDSLVARADLSSLSGTDESEEGSEFHLFVLIRPGICVLLTIQRLLF
jgi:hypothetical protein